ncbi:diaminopimelate epimerase [Beutenbergia cavernae DSM 12333]|uniref:Diaminopimelate epimerase n=1 Tax=Beutenbergia cavernae (strain ATCC BAA-8 / DSM 12333 / CCUG 43141 / JCM 11478 / NBRC 16432 / NCIMB 13614 / HKI 0122) TaxID=471853 RepID=C5BWM2_BEUC1|nr:diaminopimelate epimerase [Beutenbergia cavernae]ACQ80688.1 diaminopimelate epimerase [Beutenbergia cavernae DSM 12333]
MLSLPPNGVVKGHGTGNDFLLLADPEGALALTEADVAALSDRHRGLGADGVIRAVRSSAIADGASLLEEHPEAVWFMDYRNADGSLAEMCGNGIRVFVEFLRAEGLLDAEDGDVVPVATRAGVLPVRIETDRYAVDMGRWSAPGGAEALEAGFDASVGVAGLDSPRPGLRLALPNPHVVVALEDVAQLESIDLTKPPRVDPLGEGGTNVELVVALGEQRFDADGTPNAEGERVVGIVRMRVHERGVGETLSCGTGACAAALAVRAWAGAGAPDEWLVLVPGGQLQVRVLPEDHVELSGPAELVARAISM